MSANSLHHALLRPAVLQILRAVGFHSARPSVIDALTDITARYLFLLASRSASRAFENHNDVTPDITDVRLAMVDCGLLTPSLTSTEEVWREMLRRPVQDLPERNGLRGKEMVRRDDEDTSEIRQFIAWLQGPINREIKRVAGLLPDEVPAGELQESTEKEDYLTSLKKKHSKTGEESRFQGTVLGKEAEYRPLKIEGGPETLQEWHKSIRRQQSQKPYLPNTPPADDSTLDFSRSMESEDTVMPDR